MDEPLPHATVRDFEEKYRRLRSEPAQALRVEALGSAVPNGYTTVSQADRLAAALELGEDDTLLDLGSGRGWPGGRISDRTGCGLVISDIPLDAIRAARAHWGALLPSGRSTAVCADGRLLPFRDGAFGGVTHTDVLC